MNKKIINYIKLFFVISISIVLALLISSIYRNYDNNKNNRSYLSEYVAYGEYNDLSSVMMELSDKQFLYVTYIGDKNIFNFEKDLRKVLKKYDLLDNIVMINTTGVVDEEGYVSSLNKNLKITTKKDIKLPAIIYYKNGEPIDYIDSDLGLISADKVVQLIDKWELEK